LTAFYPGRATIDGYGNGGFLFADMSHRGSILATAEGISGWRPTDVSAIAPEDLEPLRSSAEPIEIFILGSGKTMSFPSKAIRRMLNDMCRSVDVMSTSSAITTYNILLGEGRRVATGLIAVDHAR
jgi:uncharacterized protein